jgi:prepilin-type N-terminal cleavage/methylation domain-containing protein
MNSRDFKNDNKGISLIEIIIVLAIMALIGGIVVLSTQVATNKHVNACAEKIGSALEQTRSLVMGKQSGYLEIYQLAGDYVYVRMYIDGAPYSDPVAVGHPGVIVNYTKEDGSTGVLTAGAALNIYFSRNGSVKTTGDRITQFEITNGNRTVDVNIDLFTGRVEVVKA